LMYRGVRVRQLLSRSGLPDLDYALNPYVGCEHGCLYCYARAYTRYREAAEHWGEVVYYKEGAPEILRGEVRRLAKGVVGVSTITDPYQPLEAEKRLTRGCIEVLLSHGFRVSIQSKSPLVLRDLDVLAKYAALVDVGFTIITLDDERARLVEPKAPPPTARAKALASLSENGIRTWVFLGPLIPGLNDGRDSISGVVDVAAETGSTLYYDFLRVKPGIQALERVAPGALARSSSRRWREAVRRIVVEECERRGVRCEPEYGGPGPGGPTALL